jgi:outer membrane protein TolC
VAAQTRLQSPDARNSALDPAVALTSTAKQELSQARPPSGADDHPGEKPNTRQEDLNVPVPSPPEIPPPRGEYPIDLSTALRLAEAENPTIAAARARIIEALALQTGARALLLPSFNPGANYHLHTGNLQRGSGKILNLTEQALYFGGGAEAVGSNTVQIPAVNIIGTLTEAWFEPLAAHQRVVGSSFTALATANEVLLDVALLHLELLANKATLDAQRLTERQGHELAVIVNDFAVAGERRTADANRAQADWKLRRAAVQRAEESVAVTAARLASRLNLDPTIRLHPAGGPLVPINLIALDTPTHDLIASALQNRPDLAAQSAEVARAEVHYHEELARPWIPTVWLGYSAGVFGGGSNVVPPILAHFGGRSDFDASLFWTIMNLGAGNISLQNRRYAILGEAEAQRVRVINQVRQEITSARAEALAARDQIEIARSELASAENGLREDTERSRNNLGRPIEVLNSLSLVGGARVNVISALLRYDQAQFRLFVALGSPPPLLEPPQENLPPPPLTTPLHVPLPVAGHPFKLGFE